MLVERWRPKRSHELAGLDSVVHDAMRWLSGWKRGCSALLLYGPPGCGKTVLARVMATDTSRDMISINEADDIRAIIGATTQTSLVPKQRLVLVNDVDAMIIEDKSIVSELISAISRSRWPIILTAIDPWDPAMKPLRQHCVMLEVRPIATSMIARRLKEVASAEKIAASPQLLQAAAATAAGDMRAGLNYLELLAAGADGAELSALDKARNPFELLSTLFKGTSMAVARHALDEADMDIDGIFSWIDANILNEWQEPNQAAAAFELLSRADFMRRQNSDIAKAILSEFALLKGKGGWTRYNIPEKQTMLRAFRNMTAENDATTARLAPLLHCSKAKIRSEYIPYGLHKVAKAV
ncbi:MAG: AAA family ATPase [Candidatus Aenigmatarchaeota archaeon]|nr:AAA family ATPase [Candidatus Aenigmarchaeota archaeon]